MAINDPRTRLKSFTVKQCAGAAGTGGTDSQQRKDFFSGLGKLGDLEFLNNSSLGTDVGQGLRGLARMSNSIRIGDGALPSFLGSAVDKGSGFVLEAIGIAPGVIDTLRPLNPGVVNRGVAQADAIWEDVKDGTYKLEDIPDTFSDLQNLERLARGIYTPPSKKKTGPPVCEASPWAMDLDRFFPKYKFLFLVQFELNEPYASIQREGNMFEFVIKNSTRPNINFEYEEVNMYNFRTQVAKRTQYEPMTMRFYDDNVNRIMQFYSIYLKAMSPIANQSFKQGMEGTDWYEQSGMNFDAPQTSPVKGINTNVYSGSLGPLERDADGAASKTIISRVNLFHVYAMGRKFNKYIFFNPRIQSMELDDLDMAEGAAGNEISLQFNYDGMFLAPGVTVEEDNKLAALNIRGGANYPFNYEANGEFVKPEPEPGGALPGEQVENTGAIDPAPAPNATTNLTTGAVSYPATGIKTITDITGQAPVGSLSPAALEKATISKAQQTTIDSAVEHENIAGYLADARNAKPSIVNTVTDALDSVADVFRGPRNL